MGRREDSGRVDLREVFSRVQEQMLANLAASGVFEHAPSCGAANEQHWIGLFNRYCIRCHGVDGRGVWDIPDVPNFTNPKWQAHRTDAQLARAILEGRGSVMPPWRGALSLEEAWALARHIRRLIPATDVSHPETPKK